MWGRGSGVVLMLTREVEGGTRKCHSYMPYGLGQTASHGEHLARVPANQAGLRRCSSGAGRHA